MSELITCQKCGLEFDPADLTQVIAHERHQPVAELGIRGVPVKRGMTPAAHAKIQQALKKLEAAQSLLGEACSDLSPVIGLVKEWERLGKLHDKVKAEWHRLNGLDGPFRLDSEPKQ